MEKWFEAYSIEELEAALQAKKEIAEQKAAKEQELEEARVHMADAAIRYLLALDLITEEELVDYDVNQFIRTIQGLEGTLTQYGKIAGMLGKTPTIKIGIPKVDADTLQLKNWIAAQM